jgi:DNA-binding NtrC family response regulator
MAMSKERPAGDRTLTHAGLRGGPLKLLVLGPGSRTLTLAPGRRLTIGRSPGSDLVLTAPGVAEEHAAVTLEEGRAVLESLDAAAEIWVKGATIAPGEQKRLRVGDTVRLGSVVVLLHEEAVVDRLARPAEPEAAADPRAACVVASAAMKSLVATVAKVAAGSISALFVGETGVGKEVLCRKLHLLSPRARGPFVAVNCPALPASVIERELFGHERGAFTGAERAVPGLFERAHGGTLLLDEVGELPLELQSKLLRVLEERRVRRLGGTEEREVDVRVVAASNRALDEEAARGRFRPDLYYRLAGVCLRIPPLRERPEDIAPAAAHFLERACERFGRRDRPSLSVGARAKLAQHRWPGNLRELRNVIERAVVLCDGIAVLPRHVVIDGAG